jgi:hypothetical protein
MNYLFSAFIVLLLTGAQFSLAEQAAVKLPKEPKYKSKQPLYFKIAFPQKEKATMLGVLDESQGDRTGYDIVHLDSNMDNDLANEKPKKLQRGRRIEFKGPLTQTENADYVIDLHSLYKRTSQTAKPGSHDFYWYLNKEGWTYFFINGKIPVYENAAEALKGRPVYLGGKGIWDIKAKTGILRKRFSVAFKDQNGSTLRSVRGTIGDISPYLKIIKKGKVVKTTKMEFG